MDAPFSSEQPSFEAAFTQVLKRMLTVDFVHSSYEGRVYKLNDSSLQKIQEKLTFIHSNISKIPPLLKANEKIYTNLKDVFQKIAAERLILFGETPSPEFIQVLLLAREIYNNIKNDDPKMENFTKKLGPLDSDSLQLIDAEILSLTERLKAKFRLEFSLEELLEKRIKRYPDEKFSPLLHNALQGAILNLRNENLFKGEILLNLALNHGFEFPPFAIPSVIKVCTPEELGRFVATGQLRNKKLSPAVLKNILQAFHQISISNLLKMVVSKTDQNEFHNFLKFALEYFLDLPEKDHSIKIEAMDAFRFICKKLKATSVEVAPEIQYLFTNRPVTVMVQKKDDVFLCYNTDTEALLNACMRSPVLKASLLQKLKEGNEEFDLVGFDFSVYELEQVVKFRNVDNSWRRLHEIRLLRLYEIADLLQHDILVQEAMRYFEVTTGDLSLKDVLELLHHPAVSINQTIARNVCCKILASVENQIITDENRVEVFELYQLIYLLVEEANVPNNFLSKIFEPHYPKLFKILYKLYEEGSLDKTDYLNQLEKLQTLATTLWQQADANTMSLKRAEIAMSFISFEIHEIEERVSAISISRLWLNPLLGTDYIQQMNAYMASFGVCEKGNSYCIYALKEAYEWHKAFVNYADFEKHLWIYIDLHDAAKKANMLEQFSVDSQLALRALIHYLIEQMTEGKISSNVFDTMISKLASTQFTLSEAIDEDFIVVSQDLPDSCNMPRLHLLLNTCTLLRMEHLITLSKLRVDLLLLPNGTFWNSHFSSEQKDKIRKLFPLAEIRYEK